MKAKGARDESWKAGTGARRVRGPEGPPKSADPNSETSRVSTVTTEPVVRQERSGKRHGHRIHRRTGSR